MREFMLKRKCMRYILVGLLLVSQYSSAEVAKKIKLELYDWPPFYYGELGQQPTAGIVLPVIDNIFLKIAQLHII